jgi:hypothetical protein
LTEGTHSVINGSSKSTIVSDDSIDKKKNFIDCVGKIWFFFVYTFFYLFAMLIYKNPLK